MKKIGITGGIGSGKTAVTDYLEELGYTVLDADLMSRALTALGEKEYLIYGRTSEISSYG